jgi:uncharacterized protein YneF (UPF0154 family)
METWLLILLIILGTIVLLTVGILIAYKFMGATDEEIEN